MRPQIILLNGTSSSGKTSLAKTLQAILPEPYFHVCIDAFEDMMPEGNWEGGHASYIERLRGALQAMYGTISSLAANGNRVIVDHVLLEEEEPLDWVPGYIAETNRLDAFNVKVFAPLELLRARELARGDRRIGLAEWQSSRMHRTIRYDLEIDTSTLTPEEGARSIIRLLDRDVAVNEMEVRKS